MLRVMTGGRQISNYIVDSIGNVTAAYSLRKLSSSYDGAAIRVRRSSDNTELDIGFVNNILDTSSLTAFVGANDGFITKWYDQTTNAFDLIQATAANQPYIVASGVVYTLANGTPTIYSPGTTQFITTGGPITRASHSAVVRYGDGTQTTFLGNKAILGTGATNLGNLQGNNTIASLRTDTGSCNFYIGGRYSSSGSAFLPTSTAGKIVSADISSTNNSIPSPVVTGMRLFDATASAPWYGSISEVIVTSVRMGIQDRVLLTANQSAFYGISLSS